jgi:iron complex transport system ATP-binding protein
MIETVGFSRRADDVWPILSHGERGRTLVARALISDPRLLLLDEPTTGLDVAARVQLLETMDSLDETHPEVASILVLHHLEELATTTTHALLIAEGRTVAIGSARETVTTDNVSAAFSHPVSVGYEEGRWTARAKATPASSTCEHYRRDRRNSCARWWKSCIAAAFSARPSAA